MRWGKIAVLALTGIVGLGLGLIVAQPWSGPTAVDALELDDQTGVDDEAKREDDALGPEVSDDDDGDDDGTGTGTPNGGAGVASATDDGRDGTRDGDTRDRRGTGTGDSVAAGGGATSVTNAGNVGGGVSFTDGGSFSADGSASGGGGASGGSDT
jgi:hypothetical protein